MSGNAGQARGQPTQIFFGLVQGEGDDQRAPPPEYWNVLRESHHELIDPSYWDSLGRGDLYADAMERLQFQLEHFTRSLYQTRSISAPGIQLQLLPMEDDDDEENELPLLLHYDEKLLSRWKALFYAMAGSKCWSSFEVGSIEMPQLLITVLAQALKMRAGYSRDTYVMSFRNNQMDIESALVLSRLVGEGVRLSGLYVNDNDLSSPKAAEQLSNTIANHGELRTVDLSGSGIGRNTRCMSGIVSCPNLQILLLSDVGILPRGVAIISEFLASNPPLQELELTRNQLDDNAAASLAASLGTNMNMTSLWLGDNIFSEAAAHRLREAIFDDSSLNAVLGCNHTCTIRGVPGLSSTLQCTKEKKKFKALWQGADDYTGAFNHRLFADVPAELMPMVLAWIQAVPDDISVPLTMLFETLRFWKLPLLFLGRHQLEEVKSCLSDMISAVTKDEGGSRSWSFHQAILPPRETSEYDVILRKSSKRLLLSFAQIRNGEETRPTAFFYGYIRLPDGSKGPPELFTNIGLADIVKAVNWIGTVGRPFGQVIELLDCNFDDSLSYAHVRFQSVSSFYRPPRRRTWAMYDEAYHMSIDLQQKKAAAMTQYQRLAESRRTSERQAEIQTDDNAVAALLGGMLVSVEMRVLGEDIQQLDLLFKTSEKKRGELWTALLRGERWTALR